MGIIAKIFKEEPSNQMYYLSLSAFISVAVIGAFSGLFTWLIAFAINKLMLVNAFCSNIADSASLCANSTNVSCYVASILVGIMTIPILALTGIKRALLIVVAAVASTWGIAVYSSGGAWWQSLLLTVLAYAVAYMALAWINKIRSNFIAVTLSLIFVILAQFVQYVQ